MLREDPGTGTHTLLQAFYLASPAAKLSFSADMLDLHL
jgi:hypothetical protein